MPNYVDVIMHHNKAVATGGEGYYIGSSFCYGQVVCTGQVRLPHYIEGLRFYSNIAENTAWEGAQFGCCHSDVWVYSNTLDGFGLANEENQNRGLQIGGGSTGHYVGNFLRNGPNVGFINHGEYNVTIANNIIVSTVGSAIASSKPNGQPMSTSGYWRIMHNTIYDVADGGGPFEGPISAVGSDGDFFDLVVVNNLIGDYPPISEHTYGCTRVFGETITDEGNVCSEDATPIGFTNPALGDFSVSAGSIAHSDTVDVSDFVELSVDYMWNLRDLESPTAGALEYGASPAPDGTPGLPPIETEPPPDVPGGDSGGGSSTSRSSILASFLYV